MYRVSLVLRQVFPRKTWKLLTIGAFTWLSSLDFGVLGV